MLEGQTAERLMEPQTEVFPRAIYQSTWKIRKEEADKRVKKHQISTVKSSHRELVERVKSKPRTLFLIVADEAHLAITGDETGASGDGVGSRDKANNILVNCWNQNDHPNVVVLQVKYHQSLAGPEIV